MILFDTYGHLTQEALQAWAEGALCEQQRLFVAEHLSVCDDCLLRMTELEEKETDISPQLPKKDFVAAAIHGAHSRKKLEIFRRCGIVAAAAAFAFGFSQLDLTQIAPLQPERTQLKPSSLQQATATLSDGLFDWGIRLSAAVQDTLTAERDEEMTQRSDRDE